MLRLRQALDDQRSFLDEFLPPELRICPKTLPKWTDGSTMNGFSSRFWATTTGG